MTLHAERPVAPAPPEPRAPGPNPFAFIVGCPRSGTTLVERMLGAHPLVAVVPEIGWLAATAGDPELVDADGVARPALVRRLAERPGLARYAPRPVSAAELRAVAGDGRRMPYADLVGWLFDRHGERAGKPLVANKAHDHTTRLPVLAALWPRARIVHVVRDGRDVSLSAVGWRRAPKLAARFATWARDPVATSALWWEWQVRCAREAGAALGPERYREVRYEELVRRPEATCRALCAFLDLPYDGAMVAFHAGRERVGGDLDAKHAWRPVTAGLRDWRTEMRAADTARWEAVAGDLLDELGYARSPGRPSPAARDAAAGLRRAFEGRPLPARWGGHAPEGRTP